MARRIRAGSQKLLARMHSTAAEDVPDAAQLRHDDFNTMTAVRGLRNEGSETTTSTKRSFRRE